MAGYEEVARISATIEANTAPFEQALARGEQRGQAFASKTEAVMERAERSVEDFGRSTATAMGRAGVAHTQAASKAQAGSTQTVAAMNRASSASRTAAARTQADAVRMGAAIDGVGKKAAGFGRIIGASLGFAGAYGFGRVVSGVIQTGMTFDAQMSRVRAVTGSTQAQFDALRGSAIKLGADSVFSATEAAQGMEILGAAGLSSSQVIAAMPGLLDGAAASGEDFAGTASILTASLGAFNLKAEASSHIMDVLAASAMASDASIGDIGESLKYAAPVAKSFGMSIEQTAAVLTLFAQAGIKGSQGGTALRASLLQLSDGRGASAKALKAIGIEIEGTGGKIKPFSVIVGELGKKFDTMSQKQRLAAASAIFGQEAAAGMLKVIADGQRPLDELTRGFERADGAAERMATTMTDNLAGDVEQLKGAMESAAIAVSDAFRPQLRSRVQQFQVYVNSEEFEQDAKAVVGAVVNIGEAMADTASFVYRHKDAIMALTAAYVGLRMASAGAALVGSLAGARRGAGLAGMAVDAGAAAATAGPKLVTFARVAGTAARGLTAIGLGTIAAQALWSLATSGDDAATSAEGAAGRIANLRRQIDDMPVRKVTEVVVKTKRVDGDGPGKPATPKDPTRGIGTGVEIDAGNADVFRGIMREHEQAVDRVTAAIQRQREARQEAESADGRVAAARYQREQEYQEFVDAGLSKMDAASHPRIEGLDKELRRAEQAAEDAHDAVAKTSTELEKAKSTADSAGSAMETAYRKLAGVGKGVKAGAALALVKDMKDAERVATFGTASVNAAMKKMGYVEISGRFYESHTEYNRLVKRAADGTPRDVNRLLKMIGATDTSGKARDAFLADVRQMRAEAARDIVINTYLRTHRQTINDPNRQTGTYMPATRAGGGIVTGPGTSTSDSIPALLSDGEYVVRAAMVDKYGEGFLDALNRGDISAFARGGRVRPSKALKVATQQAAIDADPTKTLRQAERQYNAALLALKKIQKGGVSKAERQKFADTKALLDERARSLVDARRGVRDAGAQKLADAQRALTERTDIAFSGEDATNRQGSMLARGTVGLGDDIASVDAQRDTNARRIASLQKDLAGAKTEETRRALTEKINAAMEQQISLDQERTQLIEQQNAAVREAELDKPRSAMTLIDAVRDLEMAKAEGTADTSDDKAARERALADEQQRQALISQVLGRGDLTEEERAAKTREMAASVRTVNQLTQALEQSVQTPTESQQFMDSAFAGGGGGAGGVDSANITRTGGGGSGVGYVPNPSEHPVFFDTERLNDLDFDAELGVGVKIMQINGWDEGEDQRIATEDRAGQDGEHAREMLLGGSTMKIRGIIAGSSLSDLWARRKALKRALQPSRDEKVLKMPDPTYEGAIATTYAEELEGYQRKSCRVVEGVTWGDRHGRYGHWFEVTLRASDPRRYSDVTVTETTGAISTGGGMASPMSSPLSSSSSGTGGLASFTNDGDYETPMILRVHANGSQVVNPIIEGSDWQIVFDGLTIGSVDYLEIDPVERTAHLNGDSSADRFQYVDYDETTWGLLSEDANSVRLRGSSISDPSYLEIEYRPASL